MKDPRDVIIGTGWVRLRLHAKTLFRSPALEVDGKNITSIQRKVIKEISRHHGTISIIDRM